MLRNPSDEAAAKGAALAESKTGDPFAAAMRATRMPMLITDPTQDDNPIIFANDAFLRLTGYDRAEVIGRNCRFLQGAETDRDSVGAIRKAIAEEHDIHCELINYRKDGTTFWNSLYVSPVKDQEGKSLYFFASQLDVTEKKSRELEVRRQKDEIARLVADQTKELRDALEAKTILLHEVDHRVKNNLQLVSALIKLQSRRIEDEDVKANLMGMLSRVEALSTVHRRLYQSDDVASFDISEFARDLTHDLIAANGRSDIEAVLRLDRIKVPAGKAAPIALIINELVTNCLKHAFREGEAGKVDVDIHRMNGDYCIIVEDDGVGMKGQELGPETFGRSLVTTLTRQLNGTVQWITKAGTRVELKLPVH